MALFNDESYSDRYLSVEKLENNVLLSQSFHPLLKGGIFLWGTARDITYQKVSEQRLKDSKRELAQIIEFLPDATMVINAQGQFFLSPTTLAEKLEKFLARI